MIGFLGNIFFLTHPLKDFLHLIPGTYCNTCQLSSLNGTSGKMVAKQNTIITFRDFAGDIHMIQPS